MSALHLVPACSGRLAIGPTNLGIPMVVRLIRERRRWIGIGVYGVLEGRDISLSSPWDGAQLLEPGDAVRIDGGDGPRPVGGKVGVIVGESWVVMTGAAADAAWLAAGADGVEDEGGGPG